jgi:hypothetical protein
MAAQHQGWIPLDEAITDYLSESEQSIHKYHKIWYLAFRAMTELGIDFFYQVKTAKLIVLANKTVQLPGDYLKWVKIGVFNAKGEIIPAVHNSKMSTYRDLMPDRIASVKDNSLPSLYSPGSPVFFNYWNGSAYENLYGLPSGGVQVGQFKVDENNGVIVLNPDFAYSYVALEYSASPKEGVDYYVPLEFKEAIIAYLRWRDIIGIPTKTHVENANVAMRRHEYYNERRLAIARYKPLHLEQAYEWNLQNQRLTTKA